MYLILILIFPLQLLLTSSLLTNETQIKTKTHTNVLLSTVSRGLSLPSVT